MKLANLIYDIVAEESKFMDAIYESYILDLVGMKGLNALLEAGYLETCGVVNGRQLYVLTEKKNGSN